MRRALDACPDAGASSTDLRGTTVVSGAAQAAETQGPLRLSWWIRAPRSIRCIPLPRSAFKPGSTCRNSRVNRSWSGPTHGDPRPASACAWLWQPAQRRVCGCGNLHRGLCTLPLPYNSALADMDGYGRNVRIEVNRVKRILGTIGRDKRAMAAPASFRPLFPRPRWAAVRGGPRRRLRPRPAAGPCGPSRWGSWAGRPRSRGTAEP